jgi:hypothetical protein
MAHGSHNNRLRNYTNIPFEIFVAALTILPFFLLAYFYPVLSDRVPLFMKLNGEVAVWGEKNLLSVFRVPLMAVVTQIVLLVMKYGSVQSTASAPLTLEHSELQERQLKFTLGLWDWFRWTAAFKMSAESLDTIFRSVPKFNFLARPVFIISAIAALIGVVGALLYCFRVVVLCQKIKKQFGVVKMPVNFNFANISTWILIGCVIVYLLLVFVPA